MYRPPVKSQLMPRQFNRMIALRYRDFRYLWFGEMVSTAGMQMQLFAINWHVFELLRGQTFTLNLFGSGIVLGSEAFGLGLLGLDARHSRSVVRSSRRNAG